MELIRRIDYFGATLLLAASVLFITALEEGGTEYSWHSALVLVLLVLSFFVWIAFLVREKLQGQKKVQHESVFPWRLVTNRFWMGIIMYDPFP